MRGRTLTDIVQSVWFEANRADSPQANASAYNRTVHMINRVQRMLYEGYDWRFLKHHVEKQLMAGERFYDFPDEIDRERVTNVFLNQNDGRPWLKLCRGITPAHYHTCNSLRDERRDPAERWDLRDVDGVTQFEIWPVPQTRSYTVLIEGLRPLKRLVEPGDFSALDGDVIALYVAAELLGEKGGAAKAALAASKLAAMQSNDAVAPEPFSLNGGSRERLSGINIEYIPG